MATNSNVGIRDAVEEDKTEDEVPAAANEPLTKKLRCSDHDLKIIVRDRDDEGNVTSEKEYYVYGLIFAKYSKFIDVTLSSGMQEEKKREIVFHDVSPETFESAIRVLEDPAATRSMDAHNALEFVEFYDKYEFEGGLRICDQLLTEFLRHNLTYEDWGDDVAEETFDMMVDITSAANNFNLPHATKAGREFFAEVMADCTDNWRFNVDQVKRLQPFMIRHEAQNLQYFFQLSQEEMESTLFPKFFIQWQSKQCVVEANFAKSTGDRDCSGWPIQQKP
jgi:BTB/POZ domain